MSWTLDKIIVRKTGEGLFVWIGTLDFWMRVPAGLTTEGEIRSHLRNLSNVHQRQSKRLNLALRDGSHLKMLFEEGPVPRFFVPPAEGFARELTSRGS